MHILFLCIDRYQNNGLPFYLVEIRGKPLIEYQLLQFRKAFPDAEIHIAIDEERQEKIIKNITDQNKIKATFHVLPKGTKGAACSALFVTSSMVSDDDIFIVSTNEFVNCNLEEIRIYFKDRSARGGVLTFESHVPKYSFVEVEDDAVIGAYQYDAVSSFATTGLFWFASCNDFCESAKQMIMKGESYKGKYYIAPCFNEMILKGQRVCYYRITVDQYCPLKNDNDLIQAALMLTKMV